MNLFFYLSRWSFLDLFSFFFFKLIFFFYCGLRKKVSLFVFLAFLWLNPSDRFKNSLPKIHKRKISDSLKQNSFSLEKKNHHFAGFHSIKVLNHLFLFFKRHTIPSITRRAPLRYCYWPIKFASLEQICPVFDRILIPNLLYYVTVSKEGVEFRSILEFFSLSIIFFLIFCE